MAEHRLKCEKVAAQVAAAHRDGVPVGLAKSTSNLFRHREAGGKRKIDVRGFNRVLGVDREAMVADVEGMTTYEDFVAETLKYGLLPTVVPQLKTITIGGAVSGIGIESSSFRYGLVHETVEQMDILLGNGDIVTCSQNENADLFFGFPNSYGTLGYVLRLRVKLIPAKPYVHVIHTRFSNPDAYFAHIPGVRGADYLDGTIFNAGEMYLTAGEFADSAPRVSNYTYTKIYYQSIQRKKEDWLTAKDYIWRWDTDWFWCSKHFYVQNPLVRVAATPWALNSKTYQRIMRLAHRLRPGSDGTESVIQDVDFPVEHAPEFFHFLLSEIGITPIWVCPFRAYDRNVVYPLYAFDPNKLYINFGFWDTVPTTHEDGYFNRKIEEKAHQLDGKKGLYSTAYYDRETFWQIYNGRCYAALKDKYDPKRLFPDLYAKCVAGNEGQLSGEPRRADML